MSKVVIHDRVLEAIDDGAIEALFATGVAIIEANRGNVPDAPPYGEGLVDTGRVMVYKDGRLVRDSNPQDWTVPVSGRGIEVFVGYGGPAGFLEFGTVNMDAEPFVTAPVSAGLSNPSADIGRGVRHELARFP